MNPLDEALEAKEAAQLNLFGGNSPVGNFARSVGRGFAGSGGDVGKSLATGAAATAGAAAIGGVAMGAHKLMDAVRKRHDFRQMMEVNADLAGAQEENPQFFNHAYTSLRSMVPSYARDPIIAGNLMRRMVDSPEGAGSILMGVLKPHDTPRHDVSIEGGVGPLKIRRDL